MIVYLFRRLLLGFSVLAAAVVVTFVVFFMGPGSGNAVSAVCGEKCDPQREAIIRESLGIDKPLPEQFAMYAKSLVAGSEVGERKCAAPCLGWSYVQNRPVRDMITEALPVTFSVVLGGAVVYVIMALLFGVLAARHRATWVDRTIVGSSQLLNSLPYFLVALLFYLIIMVYRGWLPRSGYTSPFEDPGKWVVGMIGVWICFGIVTSTGYIRYVRASMIDAQAQDYVRTARSKGISERTISVKHALRAAIAPFITLVGLGIGVEFGGAIFTERIFNLNGMGKLAIDSFTTSDLPVISGTVLVGAVFIIAMNLIVDLLYGVVDPRVKLS